MTNEELTELLAGHTEEWKKGFFAAVNLSSASKAAFLEMMRGEKVTVIEDRRETDGLHS